MAVRREEVRVTADVSNFTTKMAAAGAAASGFARKLDEADGRMSNLVQTGLALAPALVPLGAAAIPAIAGLSNELGVAALAAGATVLAFKGVGTAVKALDTYKLTPTVANFTKLQAAMAALGPAGQEFALFVDRLHPKLRALQSVAEQGLLPGVQASITTLLPLLPEAQRLIFAVSSTLGDLVKQGAQAVRDSSWQDFFKSLEADSSVTLDQMGRTIGNIATGFRDLITAFLPTAQAFDAGLLGMSRSFEQWAAGLSKTQGFQNFLSYLASSGPKALDALGAIANALLQIVEAAAPVGQVALPAITAVARGISALADSSAGPAIIATAAAIGVLGRSLALLKTVGLRGGADGFLQKEFIAPSKGVVTSFRAMSAAQKEFAAAQERTAQAAIKARDMQFALVPDKTKRAAVSDYTSVLRAQEEAEKRVGAAAEARSAAIRSSAASFAKGAAAAAGFAVATTGVADGMGLSNTASLALMGTLVGPWGAAVLGGVGLVKDLASANNDLESSVQASGRAIAGQAVNFSQDQALLNQALANRKAYEAQLAAGNKKTWNPFDVSISGGLAVISNFFTHSSEESKKATDSQIADLRRLHDGATAVYSDLNSGHPFKGTTDDLTQFVNHITPALTQAGIKVKDFLNAASNSSVRLNGLQAIRDYFASFDSATGKSREVGKALEGLASEMQTTATQANALKTAMDNLFGIQLSQSAATDAWTQSLKNLSHQLKDVADLQHGTSKAALEDRASIRDSVSALQAKINADAAAGVSGDKLVGTLLRGRDAIIRQGIAAGLSRKQVKAYLDTLGLTPKNLTTIIMADGALSAKQKVQALLKLYNLTPRQLKTIVSEAGANPTAAKIDALARKYHLTPKEVRTLLSAEDKATAVVKKVKESANSFAKGGYSAKLYAQDKASNVTAKAKTNATNFAKGGYSAKLFAVDRASSVADKAKGNANDFAHGHYSASIQARDNASATIQRVKAELAGIHDVQAKITTTRIDRHIQYDTQVDQRIKKATGGYVRGPGTTTSDDIPALLSDKEYVIKAAAVDKYGVALFDRLNSMTFADGGLVQRFSAGGQVQHFASGGQVDAAAHKRQLKAIQQVTDELGKLRDQIKSVRQTRNQYASSVSQAFVSDPFGGTLGGFDSQIAYETKRLRGAKTDLAALQKNGIGPGLYKALAASGNATLIDQFASLSKRDLAARATAFRTRNALDYGVGSMVATDVYGKNLRDLNTSVTYLTRELHALRSGKHVGNQIVNFNGSVSAPSVDALARKIRAKVAVTRARQ